MAKARITHKTIVLSSQGGRSLKKRLISGEEFVEPQEVHVLSENKQEGTVVIIDPLDPERVLTIAAEAVELYNEAVGVFQSIALFWGKVKGFFKRVFGKK